MEIWNWCVNCNEKHTQNRDFVCDECKAEARQNTPPHENICACDLENNKVCDDCQETYLG